MHLPGSGAATPDLPRDHRYRKVCHVIRTRFLSLLPCPRQPGFSSPLTQLIEQSMIAHTGESPLPAHRGL